MSMTTELTNLLPRSSVRALRRQYFVRLVTVALLLGVVLMIIHGILLLPAYLYAHAQVAAEQQELNHLNQTASSAGQKEDAKRITAVQTDISYLGRLAKQPTASGAVRVVLLVPHPGITLTGFTFSAPTDTNKNAQMMITGKASTRDTLRAYVDALGQLPYVSKADLPISAYAKDSNIPFSITLTGTLLP